MRPVLVVVVQECGNPFATLNAVVGWVQVDVIVFECPPESFDEHVVDCSTRAVHRDLHLCIDQDVGECLRGELRSLVGIEDLRGAKEA